jgi:hypothetical protein
MSLVRQSLRAFAAGVAVCCAVYAVAAPPVQTRVAIDNFTFNPDVITVPVGTKIVWENDDDIPHTIVETKTRTAQGLIAKTIDPSVLAGRVAPHLGDGHPCTGLGASDNSPEQRITVVTGLFNAGVKVGWRGAVNGSETVAHTALRILL